MLASSYRITLLLAGVAGIAVAAPPVQERAGTLVSQIVPQAPPQQQQQPVVQQPLGQPQMVQAIPQQPMVQPVPAIAGVIDSWKRLQQGDGWAFSDYANFLLVHPGFPGETSRRAAAETTPNLGSASPSLVAQYFSRFPPLTPAGRVRYADALIALGRSAEANEQARLAWRAGVLRAFDESRILGGYPGALRPEDHDARMDMLLWKDANSAATRQLGFTSPAMRPLFEARIAFRTNAADAATKGAMVPDALRSEPGFIADRAKWLRDNGQSPAARAMLAQPRVLSSRPGNVEEWYEVLLANARGAAADGQYSLAYGIASQVDDAYPSGIEVSDRPYGERDDYTSLTWLAGTTALQKLGRPQDAVGMFRRYAGGSRTPQTQTKGLYWAGRAAEAAGDTATANQFYTRAAGFEEMFYGQLAAERLRQPLRAPTDRGVAGIDPATRQSFFNREVVKAAQYLGSVGRWSDQTLFIRKIADDATTDSDHRFAAELARTINRPDLAVMTGRSAMENGVGEFTAASFPTVRVPEAQQDYFTVIHAIMRQESQFDRQIVSHAGARGMMQLMPGTARETAGKLGLSYRPEALTNEPDYNIQLGTTYFQRMFALYGSYPLAVAAYNAGPGNVNKWIRANGDPRMSGVSMVEWIEAIPIFETKNYVQRVLENAVVYDLMNPQRARSRGPANLSWYLGKNQPG